MKVLQKNLLFLSMLTFVLVSSFAISISKEKSRIVEEVKAKYLGQEKYFDAIPSLRESINTFPVLSAQSVLAFDVASGTTLYEKNPENPVLPASTTKIVTALVAMDYYDLGKEITVGRVVVDGQKMGLVTGEVITVENLLNGLLVYSANDAAEVLAENYCNENGCGREFFVESMNRKAKYLGLTHTNFMNPTGLDNYSHVSTARDLVIVASEAMKNQFFATTVATKEKEVRSQDGRIVHRLTNINELLGKVDGVLGVKTGWTEGARENLVTYVVRGDKKVMIALLGSQDRFGETEELVNWIYSSYDWQPVIYKYEPK